MLTTSSCVFVPVDDPDEILLSNIAEVSKIQIDYNQSEYTCNLHFQLQAVYNGGGMKNNRAGSSLSAQDPIRLPVLSTKEFNYSPG